MKNDTLILGIDIGGSHITTGMIDLRNRQFLPQTKGRAKVDSLQAADSIVSDWCQSIKKTCSLARCRPGKIGIAMPGPFDYENGISFIKGQNKYDALYSLNVKKLLSDKLGLPCQNIRMMNDAACFLQGEMFVRSSSQADKVFGLTLGTGLGTSYYQHGVAMDAGLWDSSFADSTAENYLSSRWFLKRYFELSGVLVKDVKELVSIVDSNHLEQVFDEFAQNLASFLAWYVVEKQFELVVIGGNIANAWELFYHRVKAHLAGQNIHIVIQRAILGEESALIGAASLWSISELV